MCCDISQATHLMRGGIFSDSIIKKISPDSDSEKVGKHLMKLWDVPTVYQFLGPRSM